MTWLKSLQRLEGLTISGGEPTDQITALSKFLVNFRQEFPNAELVLYTALLWSRLKHQYAGLLALCDVVIAGPYIQSLTSTAMSGSCNQTVELLTPHAKRLYAGWQDWPVHRVQVGRTHQNGKMVMVGIPSREMTHSARLNQTAISPSH